MSINIWQLLLKKWDLIGDEMRKLQRKKMHTDLVGIILKVMAILILLDLLITETIKLFK